jgi:hypothetical protein
MNFRLVRPIVAVKRHKRRLLPARKLRVQQRLKRMIKNTRHLSRRRAQPIQNPNVVQKRDHRRDMHPVLRHERLERAERMDVRRPQRQPDFLVRLPELPTSAKQKPEITAVNTPTKLPRKGREKALTAVSITPASV